MSGYEIKSHSDYTQILFQPAVNEMSWTDLEAAGRSASDTLSASKPSVVVADLSALSSLPEGFVAVLLRIWRSLDHGEQKFAVVATEDSVIGELKSAGLESMWPVADSMESAGAAIGVSAVAPTEGTAAPVTTSGHSAETPAPSTGNDPFQFEQNRGYCSVQFNPVLMTLGWSHVESATTEVIEKLKASKSNSVMVDLGPMEIINSGLVASLVRIWKTMQEQKGQFSLASPNEMVTEVLRSAGLWKLWTVVDDREEAIYELGAGEVAEVENRERRILAYVAVPFAVMSAIALAMKYSGSTPMWNANTHIIALLLASGGAVTGVLSLFKDRGIRRLLSLVAVLISGGVLSSMYFNENPLVILGVQAPSNEGAGGGGGNTESGEGEENGDTDPDKAATDQQTPADPTKGGGESGEDDPTKSGGLQSTPGDPTKGSPAGQVSDPTQGGAGTTPGDPTQASGGDSSPTQGAPTGTPDDPSGTPGDPTQTPAATPGAATETPGNPTQTPGAPPGTPGDSADPTQTPGAPTGTTEEPTGTDNPPAEAPG